ncbi:hypothetical protein QS306_15900 [Paraburkholderia bonniea]|uniref:BspC domain-containing protein n=1 Tax=Paraburkholderia bonniea TaxID=2152891 RepID=UPI001290F5FF|nr:hypothetical protein [Paraburkholderia bonniea]WJF92154.1 hypothetical protein QS306_15900 [Paraburkholderia bonniea]WJF95475.1 hypothetical protein QS308_15905 [Paraburkholderia bonniea]
MDQSTATRRPHRAVFWLAAFAASIPFLCITPAFADQIDQRNELAAKFVDNMAADPLIANCATHANFVASTSAAFDHVEFPPGSFDSTRASLTPWNDSFDEGKQRVKVDSIVTVEGLGIRKDGGEPSHLKFRCGYVGDQVLAFSWNDPVPALKPRSAAPPSTKKKAAKGKHTSSSKATTKRTKAKSSSKAAVSKSGKKSPAKKSSSTTKKKS